ncbi:hypothetical protein NFI96_007369 [Prochilodus magdalenae]|nr:hypothetical protein NFI96_007369 [Prochilodus magdalenae]
MTVWYDTIAVFEDADMVLRTVIMKPDSEDSAAQNTEPLPFVPFALVTVIFLHIIVAVVYHTKRTKGCTLENSAQQLQDNKALDITAHTGGSVLLPCYCPDLQTKPEGFTWKKENTKKKDRDDISINSDQYRNRVQLFTDSSPGNLSLLISHLTEEDGGVYQCAVTGNLSLLISHLTEEDGGDYKCDAKKRGYRDIRLSVKACSLESSGIPLNISAHTGGSVQLSCSCTDPHTKPMGFSWRKLNTTRNTWEEISRESDQYRNRVQLFNCDSPGNLSLLISHLTEEDGGEYQCYIERSTHNPEHIVFILSVTDPPQSLPFVPFALVTVIFLHIVVAVVYHTKTTKDPATAVRYSSDGDGVASLG